MVLQMILRACKTLPRQSGRLSTTQILPGSHWKKVALATTAVVGTYGLLKYYLNDDEVSSTLQAKTEATAAKTKIFTAAEIAEHRTPEKGIWVSYKDGVYDVTDFVKEHPGGSDKIMLGAGGPVDIYWNFYAIHKTPRVLKILEQYRIGNLSKADQLSTEGDPFANDPYRVSKFRINSAKPFNAEPPPEDLTRSFITPNDRFFVRNHLPVPVVDPDGYRLEIVIGKKSIKYSLKELKEFDWVTVTTTIQCAGMIATHYDLPTVCNCGQFIEGGTQQSVSPAWQDLQWFKLDTTKYPESGWLRDVLLKSGLDPNHPDLKHVQFDGLDCDVTGSCYGASIPAYNALNHDNDVIVALKMNGEDIPRDHGYPVRIVVPGVVGARSVKWAHRIVASDKESDSHWQQKDYKHFNPSTTYENADYSKQRSIQELPVTSAITWPKPNSKVETSKDGTVRVSGYAWSGGGHDIIRVDVTADGGKTWKEAELVKNPEKDNSSRPWPWTLFEIDMPVNAGQKVEFICKAVDSSYNQQPETVEPIWNMRGFLSNAWHRVKVEVDSRKKK